MANQMDPDCQVEVLHGAPDWIQVRVSEAAPVHGRGGDENRLTAELSNPPHFPDGEISVKERNVRRWDQPIAMSEAHLECPPIVGATERIGQRRIFYIALPEDADARVYDLCIKAFGVEEFDSRIHILPLRTFELVRVEVAQGVTHFFFAVTDHRSQKLLNITDAHGLAINDHRECAGLVRFNHECAISEQGIDVTFEEV